MQAALLLTCSGVAHVLITIEMAIWVQVNIEKLKDIIFCITQEVQRLQEHLELLEINLPLLYPQSIEMVDNVEYWVKNIWQYNSRVYLLKNISSYALS